MASIGCASLRAQVRTALDIAQTISQLRQTSRRFAACGEIYKPCFRSRHRDGGFRADQERLRLSTVNGGLQTVPRHADTAGDGANPQETAMGLFTKDIKTMDDLFVHQLQDIYYAEKQLVKALPKMADKATDAQLKQGFLTHLDETKVHVQRLEQVFQMHGVEAKAVDCPAIDGIIEEAEEVTGEVEDKNVLDAALINAAQAAEHYEITRYGSLIAWAKQLGRNDCASVLQKTLDEEKATDKKLTTLAESKVNMRAAG
jgi:ferritin-like metal-binding protein YciE